RNYQFTTRASWSILNTEIKWFMIRRGNRDWRPTIPLGPIHPTEFELQVRKLRLTPETYISSDELRTWCLQNRNRFYIPEWLLDVWDIPVNPDLSSAA